MADTAVERNARLRAKRREAGYKRVEMFLLPAIIPAVRAYARRLMKRAAMSSGYRSSDEG